MKTLLVLRHAESDRLHDALTDHDRPLTATGRRDAAAMGRHILAHGPLPDLILCSTALRAVETRMLAVTKWPSEPPTTYDHSLYLTDAHKIVQRLARVDRDASTVMVVGHNPDLKDLVLTLGTDTDEALLTGIRHGFPSGALAVLSLPIDRWGDLPPAAGRIVHHATPQSIA